MWQNFDSGKTMGSVNSDGSIIIYDEEHTNGARLTIEKGGTTAPFEIVFGIYDVMFHTHFEPSEEDAMRYVAHIKTIIERALAHVHMPEDYQDNAWNETFNNLMDELIDDYPNL